jgi:hypothetical protein
MTIKYNLFWQRRRRKEGEYIGRRNMRRYY